MRVERVGLKAIVGKNLLRALAILPCGVAIGTGACGEADIQIQTEIPTTPQPPQVRYTPTPMPTAEALSKLVGPVASSPIEPSPEPIQETPQPTQPTEQVIKPEETTPPQLLPEPDTFECSPAKWKELDRSSYLEIPGVGVSSEIQVAAWDYDKSLFIIPSNGIATPEFPITNAVYIFGHSNLSGARTQFANIEYLNVNDTLLIKNEAGESFCFRVSKFVLATKEELSYLGPYDQPTAVLQTSARTATGWLLDEHNVIAKAGSNLPPDLNDYLVLIVFAQQVQ